MSEGRGRKGIQLSDEDFAALRAEEDMLRGDGELQLFSEPFGDYRFLRRLGAGGMGEVYLAKHGSLGDIEKLCVVKTIRPKFVTDREYVARFIDEARVVVKLNHRNVCNVFDVGRVEDQLYMAMEFVAGRDLRPVQKRLLETEQRWAPDLALYVIGEVLEALDYAHRFSDPVTGQLLRIVHRDVSLHNIMLSFEGEVKLIDFGLASSKLKLEKTEPNMVMGKLGYMSPEQARGEDLDQRTDIYSVGVVLYELLSGLRYYQGVTDLEFYELVSAGDFKPRGWHKLDEELREVLGRATAARREERYSSCGDFKDALINYEVNRRYRAGAKDLRAFMQQLFSVDRAYEQRLFQLYDGMHTDPEAKPLRREQTVTVRIASSLIEESSTVDEAGELAAAQAAAQEAVAKSQKRRASKPAIQAGGEGDLDLGPEESTVGYELSDLRDGVVSGEYPSVKATLGAPASDAELLQAEPVPPEEPTRIDERPPQFDSGFTDEMERERVLAQARAPVEVERDATVRTEAAQEPPGSAQVEPVEAPPTLHVDPDERSATSLVARHGRVGRSSRPAERGQRRPRLVYLAAAMTSAVLLLLLAVFVTADSDGGAGPSPGLAPESTPAIGPGSGAVNASPAEAPGEPGQGAAGAEVSPPAQGAPPAVPAELAGEPPTAGGGTAPSDADQDRPGAAGDEDGEAALVAAAQGAASLPALVESGGDETQGDVDDGADSEAGHDVAAGSDESPGAAEVTAAGAEVDDAEAAALRRAARKAAAIRKAEKQAQARRQARAAAKRDLHNRTLPEKLDFLSRYCTTRAPCAAPLVAMRRDAARMSLKRLKMFRSEVDRCVRRCR